MAHEQEIKYGEDFVIKFFDIEDIEYPNENIFSFSVPDKNVTVVNVIIPQNSILICTGVNNSKNDMEVGVLYFDVEGNEEDSKYINGFELDEHGKRVPKYTEGKKKLQPVSGDEFLNKINPKATISNCAIQKERGEKADGWKFEIQQENKIPHKVYVVCNTQRPSLVYRDGT